MKRIAVICSTDYDTYPVGGMMSFIKDAAPWLDRRFQVEFWGVDAGGSRHCFTSGGKDYPIHFWGKVRTGRKFIPNLVRVVLQLYLHRKRVLARNYDALYFHGVPLNLAFPSRGGPRRINHVHGLTNPFLMQGLPRVVSRILAPLYERMRQSIVDKSTLTLLAADHLGIEQFRADHPAAPRVVKVENFCDTQVFGPHTPPVDGSLFGIAPGTRIILHVGRFSYQKDPLLAIRAFHAYKLTSSSASTTRLVMIGDGPLLSQGKALAQSLDLENSVLFLGNRTRTEIASWLAAADLYLYTSHANGYPISLAEAAQSAVAIVSTKVTGVHDLVVPGVNGFLVESRDPQDFVPCIEDALVSHARLGEESFRIAQGLTPEIILDKLCVEIERAV